MLHFSRQGQLYSSHPSSQHHRFSVGGGKPAGRWDKWEGAILSSSSRWILPWQNPLPAPLRGLCWEYLWGARQDMPLPNKPSPRGRCTQALTPLYPETLVNSPNPVSSHQGELTLPNPQHCSAVQAETGSPGEI